MSQAKVMESQCTHSCVHFRRVPSHRGCSRCRTPLGALAVETRFGCAVVDVATFPGKARFR